MFAQALGYDSDTPEQRLVIESFVMGQPVRMCSLVFRLGRESRCATGFCQQFLTGEGGGVDRSW